MGTRTVRLDEESERLLATLCRAKGLSVSSALKEGLVALHEALESNGPTSRPFAVYEKLDLGPGGYARSSARHAKVGVARILRDKARR